MNHKRGRAKNRRAGCLWCKPHKGNGASIGKCGVRRTWKQEAKARVGEDEQRREAA